jgi:dTDP-4-dehydrorhamnose reductase
VANVLVFGSTGQLARELRRADWEGGTKLTFLDRAAADLAAPHSLGPLIHQIRPDAIVIAAAYTAVDKAEGEEARALAVNAEGPAAISRAASERDVPVVYLSTDYVFDGEKPGWYSEADSTHPLSAYGRSKLAGEEKVRGANPRHIVLRTSWIYSAHGTNFVRTMLHLATSREKVEVVADQRGCPTAAPDLAAAIARLVPVLLDPAARFGTYHLAGGSETTWHGFAEGVFAALAAHGMKRPQNSPIKSNAHPTAARRPRNSRLSSTHFRDVYRMSLPPWEESLPRVLHELLGA